MNTRERIQRRMSRLVLKRPFIGALALRLTLVEDNSQPTGYTDSKVLGYNSHFVDGLTDQELDFLIMHEVFHVVLKHCFRREGRDPHVWNVAADHVVNLMLVADNMTMIKSALCDKKYRGWSTEKVYADANRVTPPEGDKPGGKPGDKPGDKPAESTSEEYGPDAVPTIEEAMKNGTFGEVRDCPTKADGSRDFEAEMEWEAAITIAVAQEKSRGTMPGYWQAIIDGRNNPHVDWKEALANFLSDAGNNIAATWSRPNRRFIGGGDYFPAIKREGIEHLVIAVDTSGSVSDKELKQFLSETMDMVEQFNCKLTFIPCDWDIGTVQVFEPSEYPDEIKGYKLGGRGGTSFDPPFEYVRNEMDEPPTALIYFTDGECSYPKEPDYPVFWGITGGKYFDPAPWGESIEIVI